MFRLNDRPPKLIAEIGCNHMGDFGIAIDVAAYALGGRWIERHFTKDRTWRETDHAASLEPPGLGKLARDLEATHKFQRRKLKHAAEAVRQS